MSTLLASPYWRRGGVRSVEADRGGVADDPHGRGSAGQDWRGSAGALGMLRYLPLALLSTALVCAAPVLLIELFAPHAGLAARTGAAALAAALSIPIAAGGAALWRRQPWSRDVVFGDLLLWGWLRRCWTERRLARTLNLYECAKRAGPSVSIELLTGLARLLEARDPYTHGHGQRVARHAERIARAMHLSPAETAKVCAAAAVHDVGKLFTPRTILNKPGRLTAAEFDVVKQHATEGAEMLDGVGDAEIAAMVRHHHERIDGRGYPDGLSGREIPLGARIIAVADTFDAIVSNRAYRRACTQKRALEALAGGAGTQLDSVAVTAFGHRYRDRRSLAVTALATAGAQRLFVALQTAAQSVGGIAPLLPALGAASVLGLSSSPHRQANHLLPAARSASATLASPLASPPSARIIRGPASASPVARRRRPHAPRARVSPPRAAPLRRSSPSPRTPAGAPHASGGGSSGSSDTAPAGSGGRTPSVVPLPVKEVTPPASPPVTPPPVPVPSVPGVTVPSVTVPPVAPVPVPPVHVPSLPAQ